MTQSTDFAFNDTITRIQSIGPDGIKATNIPLTKREYFAAMRNEPVHGDDTLSARWAKAIMGNEPPSDAVENIKWWLEAHEKFAVMRADALIKALNETP